MVCRGVAAGEPNAAGAGVAGDADAGAGVGQRGCVRERGGVRQSG